MCLNKRACTFCLVLLIFSLVVNGEVSDEEFNILPKLFHLDDYDQCMALKEHALFCSINVELTPTGSHFSKVWSIIQEVIKSKRNYRHDWLRHGVCVPESCPELSKRLELYKHNEQRLQAELSECYTNKYKQMGLKATVTKLNCETSKPRHSTDIYDTLVGLTPSLLVIISINSTLLYHANRGPMWERTIGEEYRNCRANWWTNLLYINNYYDVKHICLPPTWYLAADIQLFILALIILTLMWKYQGHTKLILGIFFGIGTLIPGIITYINNYDFLIRHYPESLYQLDLDTPELTEMYMTGHTNIGACVTGLSWGYIYYKTRGQQLFTKKSQKVLCWILVWTVTLSIIFMGTPAFKNDLTYSRLGAAVYMALARNIFSLAVGLALFAWTQGTGGFLYSGVACTPIRILGRLTYSVYLVHYPLIRVRSGIMRSPYYFSRYTNLIDACGDIMMSFICGLMLCLFVELPITALLKLVSSLPQQNKEIGAKKTE